MTQSCRERWETLKEEMAKKIKAIDEDTPWQETEPEWWLEMTDVERLLLKKKEG